MEVFDVTKVREGVVDVVLLRLFVHAVDDDDPSLDRTHGVVRAAAGVIAVDCFVLAFGVVALVR